METEIKKRGKKKGSPKTGGRVKGTPNKVTAINKEVLTEISMGMLDKLPEMIKQLDPKEYVSAWIRINEFLIPKPQRLDVDLTSKQNLTIEARLKELAAENEDY